MALYVERSTLDFRSTEIWFTCCPSVDMITKICLCKNRSGFLPNPNKCVNKFKLSVNGTLIFTFIYLCYQSNWKYESDVQLYFVNWKKRDRNYYRWPFKSVLNIYTKHMHIKGHMCTPIAIAIHSLFRLLVQIEITWLLWLLAKRI